jgi:hypothetical protein
MEELELGQHVMEKKLAVHVQTIVHACAGDAASDGRAGAGTARNGEEAFHV